VRARPAATIAELGLMALADNQLDDLLQQRPSIVSETLNAEFCKILACRQKATFVSSPGSAGTRSVTHRQYVPVGLYPEGQEPVVVDDLDCETRFTPGLFTVEHGVKSGVTVIIHGQEQPLWCAGRPLPAAPKISTEDVHFVQAAATSWPWAVAPQAGGRRAAAERSAVAAGPEMEAIGRLAVEWLMTSTIF